MHACHYRERVGGASVIPLETGNPIRIEYFSDKRKRNNLIIIHNDVFNVHYEIVKKKKYIYIIFFLIPYGSMLKIYDKDLLIVIVKSLRQCICNVLIIGFNFF